MTYCVYVLYSYPYDKIYIGVTQNLIQRINSHNELATKGYTVKFRPWAVVHTEFFSQKKEAIIREKQLKSSRGRGWIRKNLDKSAGFISVG